MENGNARVIFSNLVVFVVTPWRWKSFLKAWYLRQPSRQKFKLKICLLLPKSPACGAFWFNSSKAA